MNNNGILLAFVWAVIISMFFGMWIMKKTPVYEYGTQTNQSIVECEKSLPRDKHCVPVFGAKVFEE